jgi:DNA-binding transcriptional LysR family regulator
MGCLLLWFVWMAASVRSAYPAENHIGAICAIDGMDIRDIDLNLLPPLEALLRLRSVTLAARELDMSQSALSAALARLRALLGDPLFVRTGRGMRPTPRAAQLHAPLLALLELVRRDLLAGADFAPATSTRRFTVSLSDVGTYVLWPTITRTLRQRAPGVAPRLVQLPLADIPAALEDGTVDIAIGAYPRLPAALYQRRLYERHFVALVRAAHPLAGRRLSVAALAGALHVTVRTPSGVQAQLDVELARRGLARQVALELPSYLMLPPLLDSDDYLAVVPGQLADAFCRHGGYASLKLPLRLPQSLVRLHWHRRFHDDPANRWLRDTLHAQLAGAPANGEAAPG